MCGVKYTLAQNHCESRVHRKHLGTEPSPNVKRDSLPAVCFPSPQPHRFQSRDPVGSGGLTEQRSGEGMVPSRSLTFLTGTGSRFLLSQMSEQTTEQVWRQKYSWHWHGSWLSRAAMDRVG